MDAIEKVFRDYYVPLYPKDKPISEMTSYEQGLYKTTRIIGDMIITNFLKPDEKPDYYYGEWYKEGVDPEVTCWHCKKTFLCDCCDATCRLCGAPYDKSRCEEFNFTPKGI
jgi:hypothetical protein